MTITLIELQNHIFKMRDGLEEQQRNIADEMELLDPASKDFEERDFEYNFLNGQVSAFNYVLAQIGL